MSLEHDLSLNSIGPLEARTNIILPEASEMLSFMQENGVPSYKMLERAQAWVYDKYSGGIFDGDGNVYDENENQIATRDEFDSLEKYYSTENWLLSKDEVYLLKKVAGRTPGGAPRIEPHPFSDNFKRPPEDIPGRAKLQGRKIDVHGVSQVFGDEVEQVLLDATPEERAEALFALQEAAERLITLNQDIRKQFTHKAAERGAEARHKREFMIANKKYEEAYVIALDQLMQEAAVAHPDFARLAQDEQDAIKDRIVRAAEQAAEAARQEYLAERASIFGSTEVRKLEAKSNVTLESPTDKRLKEWDDLHQAELESITIELSGDVAKALGQITIPKAEKNQDTVVTRFIKTDEALQPDNKGALRPARPMRLSRANIKARRNAAYADPKTRAEGRHRWLNRKEFQKEIDKEISQSRITFSELMQRRQILTTRQMDLYQERETIKYSNAASKLLAKLKGFNDAKNIVEKSTVVTWLSTAEKTRIGAKQLSPADMPVPRHRPVREASTSPEPTESPTGGELNELKLEVAKENLDAIAANINDLAASLEEKQGGTLSSAEKAKLVQQATNIVLGGVARRKYGNSAGDSLEDQQHAYIRLLEEALAGYVPPKATAEESISSSAGDQTIDRGSIPTSNTALGNRIVKAYAATAEAKKTTPESHRPSPADMPKRKPATKAPTTPEPAEVPMTELPRKQPMGAGSPSEQTQKRPQGEQSVATPKNTAEGGENELRYRVAAEVVKEDLAEIAKEIQVRFLQLESSEKVRLGRGRPDEIKLMTRAANEVITSIVNRKYSSSSDKATSDEQRMFRNLLKEALKTYESGQ